LSFLYLEVCFGQSFGFGCFDESFGLVRFFFPSFGLSFLYLVCFGQAYGLVLTYTWFGSSLVRCMIIGSDWLTLVRCLVWSAFFSGLVSFDILRKFPLTLFATFIIS